jgi:hypothetical protein
LIYNEFNERASEGRLGRNDIDRAKNAARRGVFHTAREIAPGLANRIGPGLARREVNAFFIRPGASAGVDRDCRRNMMIFKDLTELSRAGAGGAHDAAPCNICLAGAILAVLARRNS